MNTLTTSSPYCPETPRKSLIVTMIMALAGKPGRALSTPHLAHGSDADKVAYEYDGTPDFWAMMQGQVKPEDLDGKNVLDCGCGWGGNMIHFAEHTKLASIAGFDLPGVFRPEVPALIARQKGLHNCTFTTGLAENMPYQSSQFDLLLMKDVLEHVEDPDKVIQECLRVLRPGGRVIIKFPSFRGILSHHLDRALTLPALHYLLPMRTWAAGLNYLLLDPRNALSYEPFDEVVATKYHSAITKNLNGITFKPFTALVKKLSYRSVF